jgi:internalin A
VEPDFEFDYAASLRFVLSYDDFMPLSIMPRFIVKRHPDIKGELRWRTGVVLKNEAFQSTAVIRADYEANRIDIYVNGHQRKDYLAAILLFFREINDSFEKLRVSERVPMPDNPAITADYKTLLIHAQKGLDDFIPEGSKEVYSVRKLLDLVQFDERGNDQKIIEILQRLEDKMLDKESFMKSANRIFDLKPGAFGITFNATEAIDRLYARFQKRQSAKGSKSEQKK